MENREDTEVKECYIHCLNCDKLLMQVVATDSCKIKCWNCHRKYLIDVKDGSVSMKLISKPRIEE